MQDVNQLMRQFDQMQTMMKQFAGKGRRFGKRKLPSIFNGISWMVYIDIILGGYYSNGSQNSFKENGYEKHPFYRVIVADERSPVMVVLLKKSELMIR